MSEPMDGRLDAESAAWVQALSRGGPEREAAVRRLHQHLARAAHREAHRRPTAIVGRELDDLAEQAADDALLAVLAKLPSFRGESRFTTWAHRFVMLELSHKLGRHHWRHATPTDAHDWDHLPAAVGVDPAQTAEAAALVAAVEAGVRDALTERQRDIFVAAVLDGTPLDALAVRFDVTRGAVYKTLYDARRSLRAGLVAQGYLDAEPARAARPQARRRLEAFLHTDPADVGCDEALRMLHAYVDQIRLDRAAAEQRFPGIVAHLAQCGPCGDDYAGLLAAVSEEHAQAPADTAARLSGRRFLRRRPRPAR